MRHGIWFCIWLFTIQSSIGKLNSNITDTIRHKQEQVVQILSEDTQRKQSELIQMYEGTESKRVKLVKIWEETDRKQGQLVEMYEGTENKRIQLVRICEETQRKRGQLIKIYEDTQQREREYLEEIKLLKAETKSLEIELEETRTTFEAWKNFHGTLEKILKLGRELIFVLIGLSILFPLFIFTMRFATQADPWNWSYRNYNCRHTRVAHDTEKLGVGVGVGAVSDFPTPNI
jgi:hypothetical protein